MVSPEGLLDQKLPLKATVLVDSVTTSGNPEIQELFVVGNETDDDDETPEEPQVWACGADAGAKVLACMEAATEDSTAEECALITETGAKVP